MRVTNEMIDPELRTVGRVARLLFRPSAGFLKLARRLGRLAEGRGIEGLACDQRRVPSLDPGVEVRVRVFQPRDREPGARLPGVLFLHGGGYAMGNPEGFASSVQMLVQTRPCVVVAPDYRKSFDAPYPAAVHDCYGTLLWMKENAAELGVRDDQLIVIGMSAGGGLTAAVTLMARDRKDVAVAFQLPLYPMIDDRMVTDSVRDNDAPLWNAKINRIGWDLYLGDLAGGDVPSYAAPARETDYAGLPPTATFVGDLDPFRDETVAYVERLRAAGVPAELRVYPGCFHGFDLVAPKAKVSREANAFLREQFASAVDGSFAKQPHGHASPPGL